MKITEMKTISKHFQAYLLAWDKARADLKAKQDQGDKEAVLEAPATKLALETALTMSILATANTAAQHDVAQRTVAHIVSPLSGVTGIRNALVNLAIEHGVSASDLVGK